MANKAGLRWWFEQSSGVEVRDDKWADSSKFHGTRANQRQEGRHKAGYFCRLD